MYLHQRVEPIALGGLPDVLPAVPRLVLPSRTEPGGKRRMTAGEIAMCELLFKNSVDYSKVWIHNEEFLPFGLQPDDGAMTPNGEMYFNPKHFLEDFSVDKPDDQRWWFMHEMVHVWQYQLGYWVMLRGAIRIGIPYEYELQKGRKLGDYNMEAQGNLLADYFVLKHLNTPNRVIQRQHVKDLTLYEEVLSEFLKNPSDRTNLP